VTAFLDRRAFLATAVAAAQQPAIPIIDTHIHLYDPARPQGIPWPAKTNTLIYKTTLPSRFRQVTKGLNVVGAVEVECSPWLEDNQWVLDVCKDEPVMVGTVGNLEPGKPDFRKNLERFTKNPLFRGIRCGYLWNRDLGEIAGRPDTIADLKELSRSGMVLDVANPSIKLLNDVIRISDQVPDLRLVVDHLPALYPPDERGARADYDRCLREFRQRPPIIAKLSAVLREVGGQRVSYELKDHKSRLDLLYETFGPDRVIYGSDWPNSDPSAPYTAVLAIVQEYFKTKSREAAEKYFWRNSAKVYRWVRRDNSQPDPKRA
jgi:L-fuconolactonase